MFSFCIQQYEYIDRHKFHHIGIETIVVNKKFCLRYNLCFNFLLQRKYY